MKNMKVPLGVILLILGLLFIFEILVRFAIVPNYLLPAPSSVFQVLGSESAEFYRAFIATLTGACSGLLLSFIIGLILACILSLLEGVADILMPIFLFFQTVPIIAVAPLMVIWFGFGQPTVIASSLIVSFFPVMANSLLGLRSVPESRLELMRMLRANPLQVLFYVRLPSAVSAILTGLEIAVGLAVVGAIVGEFVGGGGLGGLIDSARTQQRIEMVFAAVLLSSLMGLLGIIFVRILRRCFRRFI